MTQRILDSSRLSILSICNEVLSQADGLFLSLQEEHEASLCKQLTGTVTMAQRMPAGNSIACGSDAKVKSGPRMIPTIEDNLSLEVFNSSHTHALLST